jgi:hypothetical protein
MKRSDVIATLASFLSSFPKNASHYHTADFVVRYLQRHKLMQPPPFYASDGELPENAWEPEEEEDEFTESGIGNREATNTTTENKPQFGYVFV